MDMQILILDKMARETPRSMGHQVGKFKERVLISKIDRGCPIDPLPTANCASKPHAMSTDFSTGRAILRMP